MLSDVWCIYSNIVWFFSLYFCIYCRFFPSWLRCMCARSFQLCPPLCDPMNWSPPGSSVRGILQARILECVAMPSSRGSSPPRDWTWISGIAGRLYTISSDNLKQIPDVVLFLYSRMHVLKIPLYGKMEALTSEDSHPKRNTETLGKIGTRSHLPSILTILLPAEAPFCTRADLVVHRAPHPRHNAGGIQTDSSQRVMSAHKYLN